MKSNLVAFAIISILIVLCFVLASSRKKVNSTQEKIWTQDRTITLNNGAYRLELQTIIEENALMDRWIEYGFLSPLIRNQYLVFYKNEEVIKKYELPIEKVIKQTLTQKSVSLVSVPVFDICLLKGNNIEVYKVYGANYCFGVLCPEFIGLYKMDGEMITECIAAKKYFSGEDMSEFLNEYKIDINKTDLCNSIFDIFTMDE
jgi:hypothetical protein